MRKIGSIAHLHGTSAASLVALALARNTPVADAISPRHRGRELTLKAPTVNIAARQSGKTERC